jgi:hypothetical protein
MWACYIIGLLAFEGGTFEAEPRSISEQGDVLKYWAFRLATEELYSTALPSLVSLLSR